MRTLEQSISGAFSCYGNQRPLVHRECCGTLRCLADLCLPECYSSTIFMVCGLERESRGRKIYPLMFSVEYRVVILQVFK